MENRPVTITLKTFDRTVLDRSYEWLQDAELRFLIKAPTNSKAEQQTWFEGLPARTDYIIHAVYADDEPVGVTGFKHISKGTAEYFGYVGSKEWRGKGIGSQMMNLSLAIAAENQWQSVYLFVIAANFRAINLYFSKGFKIGSFEDGIYYMNKNLHP